MIDKGGKLMKKGISVVIKGKSNAFLKAILFVLIVLMTCRYIDIRNILYVTSDEFGYWASGALFAGFDWSDVSSYLPYYGYGYGIFLAGILKLFSDPYLAYKAAIVLNGFFLSIGFLYIIQIGKKLFKNSNETLIIILSAAITMYSSNLYLSQFTFTECLLWLLMTMVIYYFSQWIENNRFHNLVITIFLSMYMFAVHMRTLSIIIAESILLIIIFFLRNKERKKILLIVSVFLVLFCVSYYVKEIVINTLYTNRFELLVTNDVSDQVDKVLGIFSIEGVKELIISLYGKIFYLGASTFFLFYFGIYYLLKKIWNGAKQFCKGYGPVDAKVLVYLFLILCALGSICVCAITMQGRYRADILIYGRYDEYILPVILLCGFEEIFTNKKRIAFWAAFLVFNMGFAAGFHYINTGVEMQNPVYMAVAGVLVWMLDGSRKLYANYELIIGLMSGIIAMILVLLSSINRKKNIIKYIVILSVTLVWIYAGTRAWQISGVTQWDEQYMGSAKAIEGAYDKNEIYYVSDEDDRKDWYNYTSINYLQFQIPEKTIHCIAYEDIKLLGKNDIVIVKRGSKLLENMSKSYTVYWEEGLQVLAKNGSETAEIIKNNVRRISN